MRVLFQPPRLLPRLPSQRLIPSKTYPNLPTHPPFCSYAGRHFSSHPNDINILGSYKSSRFQQSFNLPAVATLVKEGMSLLEQNKVTQSLEKLNSAIKLDNSSAEAYCALGFAYNAHGDRGTARENFRKAIKLKPGYADAHQGLGFSYWSEGDRYNAKIAFFDSLQCDPNHVPTLVLIGNLFMSENRPEQAIEYLTKALKIDSNTALIHASIGEVYAIQSDFPRALYHLNCATELAPTYGGAFCSAAAVSIETKHYDRAERYIRKAREIENDPLLRQQQTGVPLGERLEGLGKMIASKTQAFANQKNWVEAESLGKLMLLALPESVDFGTFYATILIELNKFAEADSILKVLHVKYPNHFKVHLLIFTLLQKQGREAELSTMLLQLQIKNPQVFQELLSVASSDVMDSNKLWKK